MIKSGILFLIFFILITFSCKRKDNSLRLKVTGELLKPSIETHNDLQIKSLQLIDSLLGEDTYRKEVVFGTSYGKSNNSYLNTFEIDSVKKKQIKIRYSLDLNLLEWDTVYYVD